MGNPYKMSPAACDRVHNDTVLGKRLERASVDVLHGDVTAKDLRRLGAQTMARFLVCMLVTLLKVAKRDRCFMRNSKVLQRNTGSHF